MNIEGVVQKVSSRPAGRGTAYSIQVEGSYYGCGFQPPACSEGDYVSFQIEQNNRGYWNVSGNIEVKSGGNPAPQKQASAKGPQTGNSRDQYWQEKEQRDIANQKIIQYQSSRNAAIELVRTAVENDALSLGTKKADKFDILVSIVDEITDKFEKDCKDIREHGERTGEYQNNQQDNQAEDQGGHFE